MAVLLLVVGALLAGCVGGTSSGLGGGSGGGLGGGSLSRDDQVKVLELSERLLQAEGTAELEEYNYYLANSVKIRVEFGGSFVEIAPGHPTMVNGKAIAEETFDKTVELSDIYNALNLLEAMELELKLSVATPFVDGDRDNALYSQRYFGYLRAYDSLHLVNATLTLSWEKSQSGWRLTQITWAITDESESIRDKDAEDTVRRRMSDLMTVASQDQLRKFEGYFDSIVYVIHMDNGLPEIWEPLRFADFLSQEPPGFYAYMLLIMPEHPELPYQLTESRVDHFMNNIIVYTFEYTFEYHESGDTYIDETIHRLDYVWGRVGSQWKLRAIFYDMVPVD